MVSDLVFKCKSYAKRSKYDANVTKHWCATELKNTILCQNAVHLGIMLTLLKVKNWRWQLYLVIMMILWTFFRPRYDYCIHDNDDDRCSLLWDIVNLLAAQMSLLSDVYSRSTGRNPGKNLGSDCCFCFFVRLVMVTQVATHSDVMLCVRKKSERGKHLPERKPVDPHRRLTITCTHGDEDDTWWRFLMAMVVFAMTTMMRRIVAGCWPTETSHDYALI